MMKIHGFDGTVNFLEFLASKKIIHKIRYSGTKSLIIEFNVLTKRVEVDIFEDHADYSVFSGTEDVEDDIPALFELIAEHWG